MPTKQEPELMVVAEALEEGSEASEIIDDYKKLNDKVCTTLLKIKERKIKKTKRAVGK